MDNFFIQTLLNCENVILCSTTVGSVGRPSVIIAAVRGAHSLIEAMSIRSVFSNDSNQDGKYSIDESLRKDPILRDQPLFQCFLPRCGSVRAATSPLLTMRRLQGQTSLTPGKIP